MEITLYILLSLFLFLMIFICPFILVSKTRKINKYKQINSYNDIELNELDKKLINKCYIDKEEENKQIIIDAHDGVKYIEITFIYKIGKKNKLKTYNLYFDHNNRASVPLKEEFDELTFYISKTNNDYKKDYPFFNIKKYQFNIFCILESLLLLSSMVIVFYLGYTGSYLRNLSFSAPIIFGVILLVVWAFATFIIYKVTKTFFNKYLVEVSL